jgi:hypothetical protein
MRILKQTRYLHPLIVQPHTLLVPLHPSAALSLAA